jgi:hypothetical protein
MSGIALVGLAPLSFILSPSFVNFPIDLALGIIITTTIIIITTPTIFFNYTTAATTTITLMLTFK